jgi:hypothetical protein
MISSKMTDDAEKDAYRDIRGADALIEWFGDWPSFQDAEVLSIELNRTGTSRMRIHTWEMSREVDGKGFHVPQKSVVVTFLMDDLNQVRVEGFNHQNVLMGLAVTRTGKGLRLSFNDSFGVTGTITAGAIKIELAPGLPIDARSAKHVS